MTWLYLPLYIFSMGYVLMGVIVGLLIYIVSLDHEPPTPRWKRAALTLLGSALWPLTLYNFLYR